MIQAGNYEGKAVQGKIQLGETETGTLQIAIDMELFVPDKKEPVGQMTTFLYFSEAAAVYSYERLRLLGWQGKGAEDIDKLDGLTNRVPCRVTQPEQYTAADGSKKMGNSKLEIMAGAGTVTLNKPLDANTFKARLKAIGGGGSGPSAPSGGGGAPPPF